MSNDPGLLEPEWIQCDTCEGEGAVIDGEFDVDCPACDGDGGREL